MGDWHFIPWTLQYLVSGGCILGLSIVMFLRNRASLAYRSFFLYGVSTAGWLLMAFLHRNAPTAELSGHFFRIDILLVLISLGFLPVFILCIWGAKKGYFWLALPSFLVGIYFLLTGPFGIFLSNFGWSYKFSDGFAKVFLCTTIFSLLLCIGAFIRLFKNVPSKKAAKKYKIVFSGYLIFYGVGMLVSTYLLQKHPEFPPLGGILILGQFAFIAFAASLAPEKIISYSELKAPINELAETYISYLNRFQEALPGTELGESTFLFRDYIEAMGLEEVVVSKAGTLVFDLDKFSSKHLWETPDSIIRLVKELPEARKFTPYLGMVLKKTVETIHYVSEPNAKDWVQATLIQHGGFLVRNGLLADISTGTHLPAVFNEIHAGQIFLFSEDNPQGAYRLLKQTTTYNIRYLCVTKLAANILAQEYEVPEDYILRMGFEKREGSIESTDLYRLKKIISDFFSGADGLIVLVDCLDQIKFANGFEKSLEFLKNIISLTKENGTVLLITIPPVMFEEREKQMLEAEFRTGTRY